MAGALAFSENVLRGAPPIACVFWRVPPCNERVFEQKWAGLEPVMLPKSTPQR